ncbi:MAG: iron-containing redox enzyme family protein [Acidimicrobiales bacterium]|nr:iron-containing redox enzyme family protein [Acidimicrobiales bacterium]
MPADRPPPLPPPRGPLTHALFDAWSHDAPTLPGGLGDDRDPLVDPLAGEDFQLALYCCYELHYRGFAGVAERWERDPAVTAVTVALEDAFEGALRATCDGPPAPTGNVAEALWSLAGEDEGPSLSAVVARGATLEQVRELAVHRSAYQRKEADPHSWALPRLSGRPKAALVEIQADEYGGGRPGASHAELFADTLAALGLDPTYGAYVDLLPGATLATTNLITLFGRQRRLRGALVGHLALFEMTSVGPMARYADGLRRLGVGGTAFYDVHVAADAHHQHVAARDLAQALADDEPACAGDILFGARALTAVERRFSSGVLAAWAEGRTSLRAPLATGCATPRAPVAAALASA